MKTLADLKREFVVGRKVLLKERFGQPMNEEREVVKVQSNAWVFKTPTKSATWLDIPKASLLEFDGKTIKIYERGKRPLTKEEQIIKEGYEKIRNKKQEEIDALSDGSTSYCQEKAYYRNLDAEYLMGFEEQDGCKYDWNDKMVWDNSIKGKLILVYELI